VVKGSAPEVGADEVDGQRGLRVAADARARQLVCQRVHVQPHLVTGNTHFAAVNTHTGLRFTHMPGCRLTLTSVVSSGCSLTTAVAWPPAPSVPSTYTCTHRAVLRAPVACVRYLQGWFIGV
jgi:hypothetical protein